MGHLINPVSLRLSVNTFWNSNWILVNTFNYINIFKKDFTLFHFLNWFIKKTKIIEFNIIISHYKIYRINNLIYINLYYYNANTEGVSYKNHVLQARKLWSSKNLNRSKKINAVDFSSLYKFLLKYLMYSIHWTLILSRINTLLVTLNKEIKFYFNIYSISFAHITVDCITKYISLKLQKKFSLDWVLFPVLKDLNNKLKYKNLLGFKIVCSGRFTRKQIATYSWRKQGSLQLNTVSNLVKYSEARVRLKYGLCGIKLWISYGANSKSLKNRNLFLVYPLYLPFKYSICLDKKKSSNITLYLNYWFFTFLRISFFKAYKYSFYKKYIRLKVTFILKYLVYKLKNNSKNLLSIYNYSLQLQNSNKVVILLEKKTICFTMFNLVKIRSNTKRTLRS